MKFDAAQVWRRLARDDLPAVTLFMAVRSLNTLWATERFPMRPSVMRLAHHGTRLVAAPQLTSGYVLTQFSQVPTIYVKMIEAWQAASPAEQQSWSAAAARLRLMVSGSAPLPISVLQRWRDITGHTLLER